MKTLCVDGPLRGQIKEAPESGFYWLVAPLAPKVDEGAWFSSSDYTYPTQKETVYYQLFRLPYDGLPTTATGGPAYEEMSHATADLIEQLYNGIRVDNDFYSISKRAFQFWSCK